MNSVHLKGTCPFWVFPSMGQEREAPDDTFSCSDANTGHTIAKSARKTQAAGMFMKWVSHHLCFHIHSSTILMKKYSLGSLDIILKNYAIKPGVLFMTPDQQHHCSEPVLQWGNHQAVFPCFPAFPPLVISYHAICPVTTAKFKFEHPFLILVDQWLLATNEGLQKYLFFFFETLLILHHLL